MSMKKILNLLKRYREKADHGDAVLVTTLISIPLLCVCFAFATGISMATWQKTSYLSAAQAAATASLQTTQSNGYLGQPTMNTFVREYLSQTGRTEGLKLDDGTVASGQGTSSNENIQSGSCSVAMINGVKRNLPYIEVQLDINRSSGESNISTYPYWSEGVKGTLNSPQGGHGTVVNGQQYRVINAKVWEASKNITWFGVTADTPQDMTCQPYSVDVSAILFGNNEDLSGGQQCFQPDMFPVDPGQVRQLNTSPTILYESPLTTCTTVLASDLGENDIVTVLGTYRTWSYVEVAKSGTKGWVPTSKLSDAKTWKIEYDMDCTADGCGTTTKDLPSSYNWAENPEPIVLENPTKANYNFSGWQRYQSCKPLETKRETIQNPMTIAFGAKGDLCFKAEFSIKTFWVTWDANGGTSGGVAAKEYPYNSLVDVPANSVKGGYTSLGWFTHPTNAVGKVTGSQVRVTTGDLKYYQHYAKASNEIRVAANGGAGGSSNPSTYQINETAAQTVQLTRPSRPGYTFQSWSVSGGASANNSTNVLTIPANTFGTITATANWSADSNNITVTPNGGAGGSANPANYAISSNSRNVTLTPPTRAGYQLSSWNIDTNSKGVNSTVSGNTLTIPAGAYGAISVSPNWDAIDYSITVNKNGGTGGSGNTTYNRPDSNTSVTLSPPTRAGYQFTGWTITGGPGNISDNSLNLPAGTIGNISVRADWAQIYSITVNKNGGTGGSGNTTYYTQGTNQTKPITNPTKVGYTFDGWTVSGAGAFISGSNLTIPANGAANITLTAKWAGNNYQISVNSNGGTGGSSNPFEYSTSGSARTVTLTPPTRTGYGMSGWTITTNTTGGTATISGNTLTIPANAYGNIAVRANWNAQTYTVNFNCNGRGSCPAPTTYTYGVQKNVGSASGGGTFNGWTLGVNNRSNMKPGSSVIPTTQTGNVTLYAHWTWTSTSTQDYGASLSWNAYCSGSCYAYANWSWQCPGGSFLDGRVRFYDTYANAWGSGWSSAQSGNTYVGLTNTSSRVGVDGGSWGSCRRTITNTHTV